MSVFDARLLGYKVVTWDLAAHDWLDHDANWIFNLLLDKIQPGSVLVFHDALHNALDKVYANREATLKAVELLLDRLQNRYSFVTIPELFLHGRPQYRLRNPKVDANFLNRLTFHEGESRHYC